MANLSSSSLDRAFAALGEPSRRAMLRRLEREPALSVSELARGLPIKLPTVLKHLNVLCEAGLVAREKQGRTVMVRLNAAPLQAAAEWLAPYQRFWNGSLDRLADMAEAIEASKDAAKQ